MAKAIKKVEETQPAAPEATPAAVEAAEPMAHTTGVALSVSLTPDYGTPHDDRLVKVEISYPKDFKGTKYFKDGDIKEVSPETAELFIQKGIATKL